MKQRISPFEFDDHREFLRQALKTMGFSYRSFAAKHHEIVSFNLLAMALSKGKSGKENKPMRNFSPEMLARIGKALKLSDDEVTYLLLLLWANNSEVLEGVYGSAHSDCVRRLLKEQKTKQFHTNALSTPPRSKYSVTANTVAYLLDSLPARSRVTLTKGILEESKVVQARQRNKAGVKAITSAIERLSELLAQGAP
jgi:hypothetical protein